MSDKCVTEAMQGISDAIHTLSQDGTSKSLHIDVDIAKVKTEKIKATTTVQFGEGGMSINAFCFLVQRAVVGACRHFATHRDKIGHPISVPRLIDRTADFVLQAYLDEYIKEHQAKEE